MIENSEETTDVGVKVSPEPPDIETTGNKKETYQIPILACLLAVLSTVGLIGPFLFALYTFVLNYSLRSENYSLFGGRTAFFEQGQTVQFYIGLEALGALFFVFLGLLGFLLAGVIRRAWVWLTPFVFGFFGFLILWFSLFRFSPGKISYLQLFLILLSLLVIFGLIPAMATLKAFAPNVMAWWKRCLLLLVPVGAIMTLVIGRVVMSSAVPNREIFSDYTTYNMAREFPTYFALMSITWVLMNFVTVTEALRKKPD